MDRLSNNELLKKLQSAAEAAGISVTYKTNVFYVKLLDKALAEGVDTASGVSLTMSVVELAECAEVSGRFAENALKRLSQCGVIVRNKVGKTVTTIFVRSFYEEQEG